MSASNVKIRRLAAAVSMLFLAGSAWAGDVTVYDKAPSVEELQRKLTGGEDSDGKRKLKTRAIVFGDAAPAPAQEVAPQAAPQPATSYTAPAPAAAAPAPAAQPAAPAQQTMQVGENAIAFPINFRVNSSEVMSESVPFIESIAGLLQKDPSIRLLIEGHTDSSGNPARNTVLSRERAFSVMNYLIDRYRIDPMRLVPVGKGFSEPLGGMEPTNPKNRRVQFRIIG